MLKNFRVGNFKSIREETVLDLAPLTIFVGSNSSGKSTFLQSLLLLKQTVKHGSPTRALALNGPILKLGKFNDIRHFPSEEERLSFGGTVELDPDNFIKSTGRRGFSFYYPGGFTKDFNKIDFWAEFSVSGSNEQALLQPILTRTILKAEKEKINNNRNEEKESEDVINVSLSLNKSKSGLAKKLLERDRNFYEVEKIDSVSKKQTLEDRVQSRLIGAETHHFLPDNFLIEYDSFLDISLKAADDICSLRRSNRSDYEESLLVPIKVLKSIMKSIKDDENIRTSQHEMFSDEDYKINEVPNGLISIGEIIERLKILTRKFEDSARRGSTGPGLLREYRRGSFLIRKILEQKHGEIAEVIYKHLGKKIITNHAYSSRLSMCARHLDSFFNYAIQYLGPLRAAPKPFYQLEALSNITDVGSRGEHTAAIFDLNKDEPVEYVSPTWFKKNIPPSKTSKVLLKKAVTEWIEYLGVATGISSSDKGKFGHEFQVTTSENTQQHDLTNVGVGVSQVLPIIIMSLLARNNSVLIFEQPELHLHPTVQSRLTDFFITLSLQGKQCLIETHSEYMITRLRKRTAEIHKFDLSEKTKLYFVERKAGISNYLPVNFNKFGKIIDWPKDFFDENEKEVSEILRASMKKQQNNNK